MEEKGMVDRLWDWILFNMPPGTELWEAIQTSAAMVPGIAAIFGVFLLFSLLFYGIFSAVLEKRQKISSIEKQKTVKFGDAASVKSIGFASVTSVISIWFIWALATGSSTLPFSVPTPYVGQTSFEYTAVNAAGETDTATVAVHIHEFENKSPEKPDPGAETGGFAQNDVLVSPERRRKTMRVHRNDEGYKEDGYKVTHINGEPIAPDSGVNVSGGVVYMLPKGSLQFRAYEGWTMDPLFLPPPEKVWSTFVELNTEGYQGVGLWEHLFWSLYRVILGMALGALFGIPLGYAMGLSSWLRSWFDPVVEFMRPIPPLALIPLVIIWFGIGEQGKIVLLFLAALWIMTIAARSGVADVNISKVHAAYSLGATKRQILTKVIVPNSLPQIFTGARVAMGVCWGTVVAAELVAAEKGIGKMIIAAAKFTLTDVVLVGIIIIGVVGMGIEVLMRKAEDRLIPWKGNA